MKHPRYIPESCCLITCRDLSVTIQPWEHERTPIEIDMSHVMCLGGSEDTIAQDVSWFHSVTMPLKFKAYFEEDGSVTIQPSNTDRINGTMVSLYVKLVGKYDHGRKCGLIEECVPMFVAIWGTGGRYKAYDKKNEVHRRIKYTLDRFTYRGRGYISSLDILSTQQEVDGLKEEVVMKDQHEAE